MILTSLVRLIFIDRNALPFSFSGVLKVAEDVSRFLSAIVELNVIVCKALE